MPKYEKINIVPISESTRKFPTILAPSFSARELQKILNVTPFEADILLNYASSTITLAQLKKLEPNFKKRQKPPPLLNRKPEVSKSRLPKSLRGFSIEIQSRAQRKITLKYKRKQAQFITYEDPINSRVILQDIFSLAAYSTNPKENKFYDIYPAQYAREVSLKYKEKLTKVFGQDYELFENLAFDRYWIKEIYGFDPVSVNYEKEQLLINPEKKVPKFRSVVKYSHTYKPFTGGDEAFIEYLNSVDSLYFQVETPCSILYYSFSGSLLGVANLTSRERFIALFNEIEPIDRPYIIGALMKHGSYFPIFTDSILQIQDTNPLTIINSEGRAVQLPYSKEFLMERLEQPFHFKKSKLFEHWMPQIVNGNVKINPYIDLDDFKKKREKEDIQ